MYSVKVSLLWKQRKRLKIYTEQFERMNAKEFYLNLFLIALKTFSSLALQTVE